MKLVFTIGDCNGIGLEVLVKGIISIDNNCNEFQDIDFYICGHHKTIQEYLEHFNFPVSVTEDKLIIKNRICPIINCENYSKVEFGQESISAGKLAGEAIETAVKMTLAGNFDGIVTMPISKAVVYKAGWKFPGHTEMLANACGVEKPLMILCTDKVRVGLATIHVPIQKVPQLITFELLTEIIEKFAHSLNFDFGIKAPKIAILGLNPHAGENGALGREEIEVIEPALSFLKSKKIEVFGPFPADGFFAHGEYKNFDGILAMYHDQGLIPLKMIAEGAGINYSAGLPIVRTSPDHGTAFNIAGKNCADSKSMINATKLNYHIIKNRLFNE